MFIDQLSDICEENNADIKAVVNGIKSDDRIGEKAYLNPGIGFQGVLGRICKYCNQRPILMSI